MSPHWTFRWSRATIAMLFLVSLVMPLAAAAGVSPAASAKIDPQLRAQLAAEKERPVWIILREKANLAPAYGMKNWEARGRFVVAQLQAVANRSQAGVRGLLQRRGKSHKPFWIVNTIKVTADAATLDEVARRPEVEKIVPDRQYRIPEPIPGRSQARVDGIEWNIDRIRVPEVWSQFGERGEGIVVANIDSGVQFDHPALVGQYRGNNGDGTFDHNYNWFDPSNVCGIPSTAPCDNFGHGTHTMGTMVGDDGAENQIGVAPGARWIAAKGCEEYWCSSDALIASGQWVLAPTDLNGQNPRPDLRPYIVNNSWGGGRGDTWYQGIVQSWIASGIFPAFSNGNDGSGCNTANSPGDYPESYAAGAFDIGNSIAWFSSRGPSMFGETKPNIAAPGVDVRSSVPGNGYGSNSGTSMASPHVAATVALMWAAAPALVGDVAQTRALLDESAIDVEDSTCDGPYPGPAGAGNANNVWGEGRLDAFTAVDLSPRGAAGMLEGTVTDAATNSPIASATIQAAGPTSRTTSTNADGTYRLRLPVGDYDVTARSFGYIGQTASPVTIVEGETTTQDFALVTAPAFPVAGTVRGSDGAVVANTTVTILNTPIPSTTTGADGSYSFASVPAGDYEVRVAANGCYDGQTQALTVDGAETLDFTLAQHTDAFGYFCRVETPSYITGDTPFPLSGDDSAASLSLPFPFTFYGQTYETAFVTTNGFVNFLELNANYGHGPIPSIYPPNGAIYAFWDDLYIAGDSGMYTALLGTAPNRQFVIEWRNVHFCCASEESFDVEIVLYENGQILTQYRNVDDNYRERGGYATLGIENESGTTALQFSLDQAAIGTPEFAVRYNLPPSGFIQGTVTDANDNQPIGGATVRALAGGSLIRQASTNSQGFYRLQVPVGDYNLEVSSGNYLPATGTASVAEGAIVTKDFALHSARAEVSPTSLEFFVPLGQTKTQTLTLRNTGTADMTWEFREAGGGRVSTRSTAGLIRNPAYNPNSRSTQGMFTNGEPRGWSPSAPGNVIRSWSSSSLSWAWGVGYTDNVWLSDLNALRDHEFTVEGAATGRNWPTSWAGVWPADMAYDTERGLVCQVNVGGDNGIYCWDPSTGNVVHSITGSFPWTGISQRGLAYRPDDDSFYIGGWNEGIIYHIAGFSHATPGAVLSQCRPSDPAISGLAWNPAFNILWMATNNYDDTIYQLNPETCSALGTLPHPSPYYNGGGLEMDDEGNLWMISQSDHMVYLMESGVPAFTNVPWLSESPTSGTVAPGASQTIQVTVNTAGMQAGVYHAMLYLRNNSVSAPTIRILVSLIVPAYYQTVNAGGNAYTDRAGDIWAADQQFTAGHWGYTSAASRASSAKQAIAGTDDDPLYQFVRTDPGEYRFDGLAAGVYEVELRFADLTARRAGVRIFDVYIEGAPVLPAHDIVGEVGPLTADRHTFIVSVNDGQLNIRFAPYGRGYQLPIVNAIRVTHRPDR